MHESIDNCLCYFSWSLVILRKSHEYNPYFQILWNAKSGNMEKKQVTKQHFPSHRRRAGFSNVKQIPLNVPNKYNKS